MPEIRRLSVTRNVIGYGRSAELGKNMRADLPNIRKIEFPVGSQLDKRFENQQKLCLECVNGNMSMN